LQDIEDITAVLQDSLDEMYLTHSSCHDLSDFHKPHKSPLAPPEEQFVCANLDMAGEYTHSKENKAPNSLPCSLLIL
jgi:hypothetical protein